MSLIKLATFSAATDRGDMLVRPFRQGSDVERHAGDMMPEVQDWLRGYKSDLQYIAVLVNALGASEIYGQNSNGDIFPWDALAHDCSARCLSDHPVHSYIRRRIGPYGHKTFYNAWPFVHHRNKDPNRAIGKVALSVLNRRMKRVELVVLVARELAQLYEGQHVIDALDRGEFPDVSMGCKIPFDRCTICGNLAIEKEHYCDCIKQLGMGRILDDGRRVGVINDFPRFFDLSFVWIGADKTGKTMYKFASDESAGLWVPQSVLDAERVYNWKDLEPQFERLEKAAMVSVPGDLTDTADHVAPSPEIEVALSKIEDQYRGSMSRDGIVRTNDGRMYNNTEPDIMPAQRNGVTTGERVLRVLQSLGTNSHRRIREILGEKVAARETVRKTYDVEGGKDLINQLDKLIAATAMLGSWGSSRTLEVGIDGDGADRLKVHKGVERKLDRKAFNKALDKNELHVWSLPWEGEKKDSTPEEEVIKEGHLKQPPHRDRYPYHGTRMFRGLTIHVENAAGTWRTGKGWATKMKNDYGEIHGTKGADGEAVDVYVGPEEKAPNVYVVHQVHAKGPNKGKYDEDKVMLGFSTAAAAKKAYLDHYDTPDHFGSLTEMSFERFKKLCFEGSAQEKLAAIGMMKTSSIEESLLRGGRLPTNRDAKIPVEKRRLSSPGETSKAASGPEMVVGPGQSEASRTPTAEQLRRARIVRDYFEEKRAEGVHEDEAKTMAFGLARQDPRWEKLASDKTAEIIKEIGPDGVIGRVAAAFDERESMLPSSVLEEMSKEPLSASLATSALMGIPLKPAEFQYLALAGTGRRPLADSLRQQGTTFGPSAESAPCGELSSDDFSEHVMDLLSGSVQDRSYLTPVFVRRLWMLRAAAAPQPSGTTSEGPLLSKLAAAYNGYRREMAKVAAQEAASTLRRHPQLALLVSDVGEEELFFKKTAALDAEMMAPLAAVPLAIMYSYGVRGRSESGEDVGFLRRLIAEHPGLFALGAAALARRVAKDKAVRDMVARTMA